MKNYYWILTLLASMTTLSACKGKKTEQTYINPQDTIPLTQIKWKNKLHHFDTVNQDTIISAKYTFYNTGDNPLVIFYVNPDCNCTSYVLSKKRIPTNDSAFIELKLNTKNKIGKQQLYSTVCANTKTRMYKLTLKTYVKEKAENF